MAQRRSAQQRSVPLRFLPLLLLLFLLLPLSSSASSSSSLPILSSASLVPNRARIAAGVAAGDQLRLRFANDVAAAEPPRWDEHVAHDEHRGGIPLGDSAPDIQNQLTITPSLGAWTAEWVDPRTLLVTLTDVEGGALLKDEPYAAWWGRNEAAIRARERQLSTLLPAQVTVSFGGSEAVALLGSWSPSDIDDDDARLPCLSSVLLSDHSRTATVRFAASASLATLAANASLASKSVLLPPVVAMAEIEALLDVLPAMQRPMRAAWLSETDLEVRLLAPAAVFRPRATVRARGSPGDCQRIELPPPADDFLLTGPRPSQVLTYDELNPQEEAKLCTLFFPLLPVLTGCLTLLFGAACVALRTALPSVERVEHEVQTRFTKSKSAKTAVNDRKVRRSPSFFAWLLSLEIPEDRLEVARNRGNCRRSALLRAEGRRLRPSRSMLAAVAVQLAMLVCTVALLASCSPLLLLPLGLLYMLVFFLLLVHYRAHFLPRWKGEERKRRKARREDRRQRLREEKEDLRIVHPPGVLPAPTRPAARMSPFRYALLVNFLRRSPGSGARLPILPSEGRKSAYLQLSTPVRPSAPLEPARLSPPPPLRPRRLSPLVGVTPLEKDEEDNAGPSRAGLTAAMIAAHLAAMGSMGGRAEDASSALSSIDDPGASLRITRPMPSPLLRPPSFRPSSRGALSVSAVSLNDAPPSPAVSAVSARSSRRVAPGK